jgi:hypothetical protein
MLIKARLFPKTANFIRRKFDYLFVTAPFSGITFDLSGERLISPGEKLIPPAKKCFPPVNR